MSTLQPATRRTALIIAAAAFMQMLDGAILNTSLPVMARGLGVQPVQMSVGITTYMLVVAILMPLSAWVAKRVGSQRVLLAAICIFTAGSLSCGLAQTLPQFVAARVLQGIGGAVMVPVGRMIVLKQASKAELLEANTILVWPALVAPVLGPVIGGFITTYAGWRWNFLLNLPIGLLGFVLARRYLPGGRDEEAGPFDWMGFAYTSSALTMLLYGLELLGQGMVGRAAPWGLIAGGAVCGLVALRHLRRAKAPLLDLAPCRIQSFALSTLVAGTWVRTGISATPFLIPLFYQVGCGLTTLEASGFLFAYFLGNFGTKAISTQTLRRFGFRTVLSVNGLLTGLSILVCAFFDAQTAHWLMYGILFIAGVTRSMQFTALGSFAFADLGAKARASASALTSMFQQLAMLMGIALSALTLHVSAALHGHDEARLLDFRIAFFLAGLVVVLASLQFLKLPPHAGAEVSGHGPSGGQAP